MSQHRLRLRPFLKRRRAVSHPLRVEVMEERLLLTRLIVNTTADGNDPTAATLSLREAIEIANGTLAVSALSATAQAQVIPEDAPEEIDFNIPDPLSTVETIALTSALPTITVPLIIDGYTQTGSTPNPTNITEVDEANLNLRIDGTGLPSGTNGLTIDSANCVISGLTITDFPGDGVVIEGANSQGNFLFGNFIGTVPNPTTGRDFVTGFGNGGVGLSITSSNNRIGGDNPSLRNVIVDNNIGVELSTADATGNLVQGNFILHNAAQGMLISASNNTIGEGLTGGGNVISGNGAQGVEITGGPTAQGNQFLGNFIGTDLGTASPPPPIGILPLPNGGDGILIQDSPNNTIGGPTDGDRNVIAANQGNGIFVNGSSSTGNRILGNYIGFNIANNLEALDIPNVLDGILITSADNTVGGTSSTAQNTIGLNHKHGLELSGTGATGNVVMANVIGLNPGGGTDFGNTLDGIHLDSGASNNVIGGTAAGEVNTVSGNNNGIVLVDPGTTGNIIEGNFIGTGTDGVTDVGNAVDGVVIDNAPRNTIGGTASGAGNVISGNNNGVRIINAGAQGNLVQGNSIGTDLTGADVIHNKVDGVVISAGASNNMIGGTASGAGNKIANNVANGVDIQSGTDNAILSNSIHSNTMLGIDLGDDGVTANHPGGSTSGPNDFENYPVLTSVSPAGSVTNVQGTFNGTPNTTVTIQFFSSPSANPSGFGEGETLIGSTAVTTDASGNATFGLNLPVLVASGQFVTATATDPNGNTSEFSAAVPSVPVALAFGSGSYSVNEDAGTATITIVRTGGILGAVSVTVSTSDGTAVAGTDYTAVSTPVFFNANETSKTVTIPIINANRVGGSETVNLSLSSPDNGATLGTPSTAVLTINNTTQAALQFSAATYSVNEDAGTATITVGRNAGTGTATVAFATGGGTAVAGVDYTPTSGTLTFNPGETSKTFTIPIIDRGLAGSSVTVGLSLSGPTGGTLGTQSSAVLTIQQNDMAGTLQLGTSAFTVNANAGTASLTVTRANGQNGQVTVHYATGGGTAVAGTDYTPESGTLTFNPGETSKVIAIPILSGASVGGDKTVSITLSNPGGGASLGSPSTALLTIHPTGGSTTGPISTLPGPVVQNLQLITGATGIAAIVLTFNEALDPTRAQNIANYGYFLLNAGNDHLFGTSDDVVIPLKAAGYNPATFQVALIPAAPLPLNSFTRLVINGNSGPGLGLTDASGNLLDGAGNNTVSPYVAIFAAGTRLTYADRDGNLVTFRLTGGGQIQLQLGADGEATRLSLIGTIPGRSVLNGSLIPSPTGDGFTLLPSLVGAQGVKLHLNRIIVGARPLPVARPFRIGRGHVARR